MSKETKFEWTDELVIEFADFYKSKQGIDYSTWGKCLLDLFKKPKVQVPLHKGSEKVYIQSEVDTIREETWKAARVRYQIKTAMESGDIKFKYPTLQDYLNSIKSPETLTNTVTDNSDVACLSLNDLRKATDEYYKNIVNQKLNQ